MKRYLSMLLILMWLLSMAAPVYADVIIGEMETGILSEEMSVRNALLRYFSDREAFLKDSTITDFISANDAMVLDEVSHRNMLEEKNIVFYSSDVSIESIDCGGVFAEASVSEIVIALVEGERVVETVMHEVVIYMNEDDEPYVISDRFIEQYSGFYSCSYVLPVSDHSTQASNDGSKYCIAVVAENELYASGNSDNGDNDNKYTDWYGNHVDWCAIFVIWCADQADVPTSVIPFSDYVPYFWYNMNRVYSASHGGSTAPRVGDLAIYEDESHIGIVVAVNQSAQQFTVVHGNWNNRVTRTTYSFTDSSIMGYCQPNYTTNSHTYYYSSTINGHVGICQNCGFTTANSLHTCKWESNDEYHTGTCSVCRYVVTATDHVWITTPTGYACGVCGYTSN